VIVPTSALRDEGTSYHYLPSSKYAYASKEITDGIKRALERQGQKYSESCNGGAFYAEERTGKRSIGIFFKDI